jgi:hypothetical protein
MALPLHPGEEVFDKRALSLRWSWVRGLIRLERWGEIISMPSRRSSASSASPFYSCVGVDRPMLCLSAFLLVPEGDEDENGRIGYRLTDHGRKRGLRPLRLAIGSSDNQSPQRRPLTAQGSRRCRAPARS